MPFGWVAAATGIYSAVSQADAARRGANTQEDAQRAALNAQTGAADQIRRDNEPWRQTGVAALGRLNQAFGFNVPSTQTAQSREAIRNRLLPQFTTTVAGGGENSRLNPRDGYAGMGINGLDYEGGTGLSALGNRLQSLPSQGPQATTRVDEAALNAAIDAEIGKTPQGGQATDMASLMGLDPGYQFRLQQGEQGINRNLASRGGYFSGAGIKRLNDFNSGLASQEFSNAYNRLASMAGLGQTANAANGQAGMQSAANAGGYLSNIGDARASGYVGQSNALMNGLNTGYGLYRDYQSRNNQQLPFYLQNNYGGGSSGSNAGGWDAGDNYFYG